MVTKVEDLRKLKDQAVKAIEKQKYAKAGELYVEIAGREPDPDWHQRAGEAFRRANDARALPELTLAADGYGRGGFLLKAIAVCKIILQVDPKHTDVQARLAELYSRRDGAAAPKAAAPPMLQPPTATRPPAPQVMQPPPKVAPPVPELVIAPPVIQPPPVMQPPPPRPAAQPAVFDQITAQRADAPMDALPLRQVLGGRRSQTISVADVEEIALADDAPGIYEISLDEEESIAIEISPEIEAAAPPAPSAPRVERDETDFGGLDDDAPAPVPTPTAAAAPAPPATLPKIALFSSLSTDDLRFFIERMALSTPEAGETILRQGDRGGSLYVLADGQARVLVDGREIAQLEPGSFFGEVGLLTDEPRTATIEATKASSVLEVSRELLWEVSRRSPEVLRTLLRFLRDRLLERLLGRSALFGALSPEDARALAANFVFLEIEAGATTIKAGQRAQGLYVLLSGSAEAVREGKVLGTLTPGDVFGEMSMLLRTPASADVRATKKCWVLQLPQARFQEIMVTYPQVLAYVSDLGDSRRALNQGEKSGQSSEMQSLTDLFRDDKLDLM